MGGLGGCGRGLGRALRVRGGVVSKALGRGPLVRKLSSQHQLLPVGFDFVLVLDNGVVDHFTCKIRMK